MTSNFYEFNFGSSSDSGKWEGTLNCYKFGYNLFIFFRRKKSSKVADKKSTPAKGRKSKKDQSEEEGEIASDDKEFDDGLDEDLIGKIYLG